VHNFAHYVTEVLMTNSLWRDEGIQKVSKTGLNQLYPYQYLRVWSPKKAKNKTQLHKIIFISCNFTPLNSDSIFCYYRGKGSISYNKRKHYVSMKHAKTENDFCTNFWFPQYCEPVHRNRDGPKVKETFIAR